MNKINQIAVTVPIRIAGLVFIRLFVGFIDKESNQLVLDHVGWYRTMVEVKAMLDKFHPTVDVLNGEEL